MDDFYREIIIDRYKTPLMKGTLDPHDYSYKDDNPLCGDEIRIDLRVDDVGKVTEAAFEGHGCAISMAAADLLVESVVGKDLDEVKSLSKMMLLQRGARLSVQPVAKSEFDTIVKLARKKATSA